MAGRGLRSVLQPVFFIGIASLLHALLFLIPGGGPVKVDPGTSRGIRVKTYVDRPPAPVAAPARVPTITQAVPAATANKAFSVPGADAMTRGGSPAGGQSGTNGGPSGAPGPSQGPTVGGGGSPRAPTAWDTAMAKIGSAETQGWARKSARAARQGWMGSGTGTGGWGAGSGSGSGSGQGAGTGTGGGGGGPAGTYLDPRVRMVVIQYPIDEYGNAVVEKRVNVEGRFRPVPYPDVKVKQSRFTSGWWNVYIELWTTKDGRIERYNVLRPETKGPQEKVFIDQVTKEMTRWSFEPGRSEIHVDVRFYVE